MKLIQFPEQTTIFAADQSEYLPLPAYKDKEGQVICCWKLTFWERLKVLVGGLIWHHILTFNQPLQPQLLTTTDPFQK